LIQSRGNGHGSDKGLNMLFRFIPALVLLLACASSTKTIIAPEARATATPATVKAIADPPPSPTPAAPVTPPVVAEVPRATTDAAVTNDADIAKARVLFEQGNSLYREGKYEQAEYHLNLAITLYPFMADANVVLAKILLMRASASRDAALYTQARLMLEMAQSLNPNDHEIDELLKLVRRPNTE
jgi:tetratricopeptide (TPR) repeat protein